MLKLYTKAQARLAQLRTDEDGNAAEYGLILALVALGIITALGFLGAAIAGVFDDVTTGLGGATG
ncbi:Flp family type IVb pilin [Agromyces sp. GXS1127]|uniref:Flp family type IVb pilin n=1 Tax=Agromyces sp. GXS1127 TaxID=3424181 RepID=UPI003D31E698